MCVCVIMNRAHWVNICNTLVSWRRWELIFQWLHKAVQLRSEVATCQNFNTSAMSASVMPDLCTTLGLWFIFNLPKTTTWLCNQYNKMQIGRWKIHMVFLAFTFYHNWNALHSLPKKKHLAQVVWFFYFVFFVCFFLICVFLFVFSFLAMMLCVICV